MGQLVSERKRETGREGERDGEGGGVGQMCQNCDLQ